MQGISALNYFILIYKSAAALVSNLTGSTCIGAALVGRINKAQVS